MGLSFFGFFFSFLESFPLAMFPPFNDKYLTVFSIASLEPYSYNTVMTKNNPITYD